MSPPSCCSPSKNLVNARRCPSGDHVGSPSATSLCVSCTTWLPSAFITKISSSYCASPSRSSEKAIRPPSGDHWGARPVPSRTSAGREEPPRKPTTKIPHFDGFAHPLRSNARNGRTPGTVLLDADAVPGAATNALTETSTATTTNLETNPVTRDMAVLPVRAAYH